MTDFKPHPYQQKIIDAIVSGKPIPLMIFPRSMGKTWAVKRGQELLKQLNQEQK